MKDLNPLPDSRCIHSINNWFNRHNCGACRSVGDHKGSYNGEPTQCPDYEPIGERGELSQIARGIEAISKPTKEIAN